MKDIPPAREVSGPAFVRPVQEDVEKLKEVARASRLVDSPSVKVVENGDSIHLEAKVPASQASPRTWHP